jgi:thiamine transport system permease protein
MDSGVDRGSAALRRTEDGGRKTEEEFLASVIRPRSSVLFLLPFAFILLFYFYPLASIFQESFARSKEGLFAPFLFAFTSPSIIKVIGFTFYQAALSTLATLALGLPGAYFLARYHFPGQRVLRALTTVPLVLPMLVVATAFNALLGPNGWVNLGMMHLFNLTAPPINFIHTLGAIILAEVFYNTTIVLRLVGDFWSRLDPRLESAAHTLGADRRRTFQQVTLPLLIPAIAAAALLVFIFDFTTFGVILVLGGPRFSTLEVEIYRQTIAFFNLPLAAVLSLIQLVCTFGLTLIYTRLSASLSLPITAKPQAITRRPLKTFAARLSAGLLSLTLVMLLIAPLGTLALRSVTRLEPERGSNGSATPGFTLAYYQELSVNRNNSLFYVSPLQAIGNSLLVAGATVTLSLVLGLSTASALVQFGRRSTLLESLVMLPLGTSAVTLGLGFIVALDQPPLDLRASPLLLPLAHTLVAFPFVVRSLTPALRSIKPRLRQAATMLGASPVHVWLNVDLPIVGRAILVAATFAFAISLGEFGATAVIARPEHPTVPLAIYRFLSLPGALNYGQAMALSTILMLVCAAGILAIERLRVAEIGEF